LLVKPFVQALRMENMPAICYLYHFGTHHRTQTNHTISISCPLLLCRISQVIWTRLFFIKYISAQNSREVSLDFLCVEIIRIIDSYSISSHQHSRKRTNLLLLIIPHPSNNTHCNNHQPYKQYSTKHRKNNNQNIARCFDRKPNIYNSSISIQIEKRYGYIIGTSWINRYRILCIVLC